MLHIRHDIAVLTITTALLSASCANVGDGHGRRVIAFGDSLAADPNGWAAQFATAIGVPLVNYAKGSSRFEQVAQIGNIESARIQPFDIVVFMPGINDAFTHRFDTAYLEYYESLWRRALAKFDASGATVLVGTTTRQRADFVNEMPPELAKTYGDVLRRLLAESYHPNIHLVDMYTRFEPLSVNMFDQVHPNQLGYSLIAAEFLKVYIE